MSFFSLKGVMANYHTTIILRHKLGASGINDTCISKFCHRKEPYIVSVMGERIVNSKSNLIT